MSGDMSGDLRAIVFDLDGTLVDSLAYIVRAMRGAFASEGMAVPPDHAIRQIVGLSLDAAITQLAPQAKGLLNERLVSAYKDTYWSAHASGEGVAPLFDGVEAVLDRLDAAGFVLAIATGKGRRGLREALESHDIRHRFASLQSADDAPGKPDPTMLRQALDECGVEARNAVMIGDTIFDLQMAANADVPSVAVTWGYHDVEILRSAVPNAIIDSFVQLDDALAEILPK